MPTRRVPWFAGVLVLLTAAACTTVTAGHAVPLPRPVRTTTSPLPLPVATTTTTTTTTTTAPPQPTGADGRNLGHCSDGTCSVYVQAGDRFSIFDMHCAVESATEQGLTMEIAYPDGSMTTVSVGGDGEFDTGGPHGTVKVVVSALRGGQALLGISVT